MGENPFYFNQVVDNVFTGGNQTREVYVQAERDGIASSINDAFNAMTHWNGFPMRPQWITGERIRLNPNLPYYRQEIDLEYAHLAEVGVRALKELDIDLFRTERVDGDTIDSVVRLNMDLEDEEEFESEDPEVHLYYHPSYLANLLPGDYPQGDERLEIVQIAHGRTQIGALAQQWRRTEYYDLADFALPSIWGRPYHADGSLNTGEITRSTDFDTTQDNYQGFEVYCDEMNEAKLIYLAQDGSGETKEVDCKVEPLNHERGTIKILPPESYELSPYEYFSSYYPGDTYSAYRPFSLLVNYRAGYPMPNQEINAELEEALFLIANANLQMEKTHPDNGVSQKLDYAQTDLFQEKNSDFIYFKNYDFELGTKRGHYDAWQIMRRHAHMDKGRIRK